MLRTATLLATGLALAAPAAAQTPAQATVRTACSLPAPADSLRPRMVQPRTFLPDANDKVVMETETVGPLGSWAEKTACVGFGGDSYLEWTGPNLFNTPGRDVLKFRFRIDTPGKYLIRVHVRHDDPVPDMANDCWARLDSSGEPWRKLFHNTGTSGIGVWTFNPRYEDNGQFPEYNLAAGVHEYHISGRSNGFKIDQVHVIPRSTWFANVNDPESEVLRQRPVFGNPFGIEVDDPTGAAGLRPGLTLAQAYAGVPTSNFPCGVTSRFGEFLLDTSATLVKAGSPQVWNGDPAVFVNNIPLDPSLIGTEFTIQGVLYEPSTGKVVLTDALDLEIGNI